MTDMTSTKHPKPGDRVAFTTYGRTGTQHGTLNGYENMGPGYGVMAHIRLDTGNVVTRRLDRVVPAS